MAEKIVQNDETGGSSVLNLLENSVSRRDLGRMVAAAAATAGVVGIAPGMVGAAAAFAAAAQDTPPSGGSIVVARAGDSDSLDPAHTTAGIAFQVFNNIYDTLIGFNMELTYEGILAESWEPAADGLSYTFILRQGITFHDGTEFNADAVKFNFDRLIAPETNAPAAGWVQALIGTEVVDPYTVKLLLSEPFSPLLGNLCLAYFGIASPTAVQELGDEFAQNPVGTGPWKFKEWISGESITLVPNENYQNFHSYMTNKGAPYAEELVFRNIPESQTQLAAFETGEVNVITIPPREVVRLEEDDAYQVFKRDKGTGITFLEFSMDKVEPGAFGATYKAPFDDLRVRQAVGYAINAEEIIESVLEGLAARNYGPMPNGMFAFKPEIEEYGFHFDVEKAKTLLDEAGWLDPGDGIREKDGTKLAPLLWTWTDGVNDRIVQVFQNQLAEAGFDVKIELMEVATLLARLVENVSDFDLMGWGWPEPHIMKMMVESESGVGRYKDETYHGLVDAATKTSDLAERTDLYFQASQKMLADAAMIPLWTVLEVVGVRSEVKDYKPGPQGYKAYEDIYFED